MGLRQWLPTVVEMMVVHGGSLLEAIMFGAISTLKWLVSMLVWGPSHGFRPFT